MGRGQAAQGGVPGRGAAGPGAGQHAQRARVVRPGEPRREQRRALLPRARAPRYLPGACFTLCYSVRVHPSTFQVRALHFATPCACTPPPSRCVLYTLLPRARAPATFQCVLYTLLPRACAPRHLPGACFILCYPVRVYPATFEVRALHSATPCACTSPPSRCVLYTLLPRACVPRHLPGACFTLCYPVHVYPATFPGACFILCYPVRVHPATFQVRALHSATPCACTPPPSRCVLYTLLPRARAPCHLPGACFTLCYPVRVHPATFQVRVLYSATRARVPRHLPGACFILFYPVHVHPATFQVRVLYSATPCTCTPATFQVRALHSATPRACIPPPSRCVLYTLRTRARVPRHLPGTCFTLCYPVRVYPATFQVRALYSATPCACTPPPSRCVLYTLLPRARVHRHLPGACFILCYSVRVHPATFQVRALHSATPCACTLPPSRCVLYTLLPRARAPRHLPGACFTLCYPVRVHPATFQVRALYSATPCACTPPPSRCVLYTLLPRARAPRHLPGACFILCYHVRVHPATFQVRALHSATPRACTPPPSRSVIYPVRVQPRHLPGL